MISDEDMLGRLVALNEHHAAEEARGHVRWLRPDYQIPRFGTPYAVSPTGMGGYGALASSRSG